MMRLFCCFVLFSLISLTSAQSPLISSYHINWECDLGQNVYSHQGVVEFLRAYNYNILKCNKNPSLMPKLLMRTSYYRVSLPCTGSFKGHPTLTFNMSKQCGLTELYGPYQYLEKDGKTDLTLILNMPKSCMYYGIHTNGIVALNEVRLEKAEWATTLVHEMGHEWGLGHSRSLDWEYGDCSCNMGCAPTVDVCINAPQAHKVGFLRPLPESEVRIIDSWRTYKLPLYESQLNSYVIVKGKRSNTTSACDLYLSVRSSKVEKGIAGLGSINFDGQWVAFDNQLSIHLVVNGQQPYFVDTIAPNGQVWELQPRASKVNCEIDVRFIKYKTDGFVQVK